jgi:hypothetical protein
VLHLDDAVMLVDLDYEEHLAFVQMPVPIVRNWLDLGAHGRSTAP